MTLDKLIERIERNRAVPGVRTYFGISGQRWCEVSRTGQCVILVPDYRYENQRSRKEAITVTLAMLEKFFVEVSEHDPIH